MRKKTKTAILVTSIIAAVVGLAAAALFIPGILPFGFATSVAGVGVIGAALGVAGLATTGTILIEGAIRRSAATKTQIKAANAEYQLVKADDKARTMSIVKMKRRDLKLAKSMIYMAKNNHSGLYGTRYRLGFSGSKLETKLLRARNELGAWQTMNNVAQHYGSERHINRSGRKIDKLNQRIAKLEGKVGGPSSALTPRYESTYQMQSHEGMYDNRTFGGFNNSETKVEFDKYINSPTSVALRYSPENRADFGYVVEIKSKNGTMVPIYAGSNAEAEMELFELMLLKDVKLSISKGQPFEPLTVTKMHYTSDKKLNSAVQYGANDKYSQIQTEAELDERIALLERTLAPGSTVRKRNGYLSRRYDEPDRTI